MSDDSRVWKKGKEELEEIRTKVLEILENELLSYKELEEQVKGKVFNIESVLRESDKK